MLKVEGHFRPVEISSSDKGVLGENALKNSPLKMTIQNKTERGFAQEVEISNMTT